MKNAEYQENLSCPQRDSAEHEGYAGAQSVGSREGKEQGGADLLEKILSRENLNRAYKRVSPSQYAERKFPSRTAGYESWESQLSYPALSSRQLHSS